MRPIRIRKEWNETDEEGMKRKRNGWDQLGLGRNEKENVKKKGRNGWDRLGRKPNRKEGLREMILILSRLDDGKYLWWWFQGIFSRLDDGDCFCNYQVSCVIISNYNFLFLHSYIKKFIPPSSESLHKCEINITRLHSFLIKVGA